MARDEIGRKATSISFTKACRPVNKNLHQNSEASIVVIIAQGVFAFRRMMATKSLVSSY